MGRIAVKILVLFGLVLGAWWWIATNSLQNTITGWFDARTSEGWQADVGSISRGGFPMRITNTLTDMALVDPQTATNLSIPQITLSTPIYWPGHATLTLPAEPIVIASPHGALTITTDGVETGLRLHPSIALQLEAIQGSSSNVSVDQVEGRVFSIEALQVDVQQGLAAETYDIDLIATGFAPGSNIRQALDLPAAWPNAFETLMADMTVTFDRPWDRNAMEGSRPQPRAIKIDQITAEWADLGITIGADLQVSAGGIPSGTLKLQTRNWQRMLDLASASGALSPQARPQAENILNLLSGLSGTSETLDVEITVDQGRMRMGFIPLGTAPNIVIR